MRFEGTLSSWNAAAGSGIIQAAKGGQALPVQLSAFPTDGIAPATGEALSFEVEPGPDGHKRAHSVARTHALRPSSRTAARHAEARSHSGLVTAALVVVAAAAALGYATMRRSGDHELIPASVAATKAHIESANPAQHRTDVVAASRFARRPSASCDGRTRCTQMTSCAEAKLYLKNCPAVEMDGDGDGVPCESQWCTPGHPQQRG